jgi:hypothetical protein
LCDTGDFGVCAAGTTSCESGTIECIADNTPTEEVCDGFDNDCDNAIDEDLADSDGDGVCDAIDVCDGEDDTLDQDQDGIPDCLDNEVADINVIPQNHNFGDVIFGESSSVMVSIINEGSGILTIGGISLADSYGVPFAITLSPSLPVEISPQDAVEVEVTYSPTSLYEVQSDDLRILSDDPDESTVVVQLDGNGVLSDVPSEAIAALLQYIDMAVDQGTLWGNGNSKSAPKKIRTLKDMIESTGDLIDRGDTPTACGQLDTIYGLVDGNPMPKDLVEGPATIGIAVAILEIQNDLGCSSTYWCSDNSECADGIYYCAKLPGECAWKGTCELIPLECIAVYEPVCGCDDNTYNNACEAAIEGMNVAYDGPCQTVCIPTDNKEKGNLCWDGKDNDCDGFTDSEDSECKKPNR